MPIATPPSPPSPTHRALLASLPPAHAPDAAWQLARAHPVPVPAAGQVLIATSHVALNPFDWQGVAYRFALGPEARVMGRDGAGVVVGVGKGVTRFRVGDRVWFCANSASTGTGAFQEYSVHDAAEVGRTPGSLSDEAAATLPTGLVTAGVALFRTLGIPLADLARVASASASSFSASSSAASASASSSVASSAVAPSRAAAPWILIWGGAGITGIYLISLARLLGFRVVCAASPSNAAYVRARGADVVLDRWAEPRALVDAIRAATADGVALAVDNVGPHTAALCHEVLAGSKAWRAAHGVEATSAPMERARLVPIAGAPKLPAPVDADAAGEAGAAARPDAVRPVDVLRISFSTTFYSHPEFSAPFLDICTDLLARGRLEPARVQRHPGGLDGIAAGLDDLRAGKVKGGYKLVVRLDESAHAVDERILPLDRQVDPADVRDVREIRPVAIAV
ncbi:hypothetical protein Q5752_002492 [Cryptotrichosporon argae]